MLRTAIAFIIFNRPHTTERVFAEIAKARPSKLFVVADGPRQDHPDDFEKCQAARAMTERVDWECDVLRNYSDVNLGCGQRPATGISWVFEHEEEAIILEDDCVPHPTFFLFCQELLERYCDDERVMMMGGANLRSHQAPSLYSYHFSRIPNCFGAWATWRRAWEHFDMEMKLWPVLRDTSWLQDIVGERRAVEYYRSVFNEAYAGASSVDYWDFQWAFACWSQSSFTIVPNANLVSNIGFGKDATHTKRTKDAGANVPLVDMAFPLRHPPFMVRSSEFDQIGVSQVFLRKSRLAKLRRKLHKKLRAGPVNTLRKSISYLRAK